MTAAVETPPSIRFSGTIKESVDGAETPEADTRRSIGNNQQPLTQEGSKERRAKRHTRIPTMPDTDGSRRKVMPTGAAIDDPSCPLHGGALKRDTTLLTRPPPAQENRARFHPEESQSHATVG
jgi:hypothetical protein